MEGMTGGLITARALLAQHFGYGGLRSSQVKVLGPLLAGHPRSVDERDLVLGWIELQ